MADETITRVGTMLEELGARFELVVEAVSGLGGRIERLKQEVFDQFAEIGSQMRFLSDQIGENRSTIVSLKADFGAEMVRLGEMIGRTRVELREQMAAAGTALGREVVGAASERIEHQSGVVGAEIRREIAESAALTTRKLAAEIKQTSKTLAQLSRKFERFDDRVTVQVRDQEQRLKKLETRGRR